MDESRINEIDKYISNSRASDAEGKKFSLNDAEELVKISREAIAESKSFRELLWLRHGCSISDLYGDDGEMQCNRCRIDFKRWPPSSIISMWKQLKPKGW